MNTNPSGEWRFIFIFTTSFSSGDWRFIFVFSTSFQAGNGGLYSSLPLHFKRGIKVSGKDEYKPPFPA
jgi:hypothetical protein